MRVTSTNIAMWAFLIYHNSFSIAIQITVIILIPLITAMRTSDILQWKSLERWSPTAFITSGVLWLGDTVLLGLAMMDIYAHGLLNGVFILTALLTTMVGLLGFYPRLADRVPRLALATAMVGAVAAGGLVVAFVWVLGAIALAGVSTPPGVFLLLPLLTLGLFGVVSLWIDVPSRTVGLLLLAYLGIFVGASLASNGLQFGLAGLVSVIALAIGYVHHTGSARPDRAESTVDSTA